MEEHLILRLPTHLADRMRELIAKHQERMTSQGLTPNIGNDDEEEDEEEEDEANTTKNIEQMGPQQQQGAHGIPEISYECTEPGGRDFVFNIGDEKYYATLQNLPCIVETQKTMDQETFYKSADVGQLLLVHDCKIGQGLRPSATYELDDGITPPMQSIVSTRYKPMDRRDEFDHETLSSLDLDLSSIEADLLKRERSAEEFSRPFIYEELVEMEEYMYYWDEVTCVEMGEDQFLSSAEQAYETAYKKYLQEKEKWKSPAHGNNSGAGTIPPKSKKPTNRTERPTITLIDNTGNEVQNNVVIPKNVRMNKKPKTHHPLVSQKPTPSPSPSPQPAPSPSPQPAPSPSPNPSPSPSETASTATIHSTKTAQMEYNPPQEPTLMPSPAPVEQPLETPPEKPAQEPQQIQTQTETEAQQEPAQTEPTSERSSRITKLQEEITQAKAAYESLQEQVEKTAKEVAGIKNKILQKKRNQVLVAKQKDAQQAKDRVEALERELASALNP